MNSEQEYLVQKIRTQYTEKQHSELDALKALDRKARRPAEVFAYIFGSVGTLVMGSGMSLVMTDVGTALGLNDAMIPGIVVGVLGLIMALGNYPIYRGILNGRRKKYARQIIELSDKLAGK